MIRAMLYRVSLLQALAVMIIISLLLPLPLLMLTYVNSTYKTKQEEFTTLNTKKFNLSSAIFVESLWNFYPELGQKMLEQLLLDPNLKFVYVKDSDGKLFLEWESKEKVGNNDDTLFLQRTLEKDNVVIGSLEMGFKRQDVVSSVVSDITLFGSIFFLQILFLVFVISWIYYYKIIKPIRRLVGHSNLLAQQKLDVPFEWDENDEIGTLGFALDKTRIKLKGLFDTLKQENMLLDEKVKQRTKELEDASRYKSEFLANMSHEIRTPMNAIMGMSHLISKTAMNSTQASYVSKIKEASSVLLRIINDILDFSKIEAGKMEVEAIAFDLHKELKKSCSIFSVLAKEKGIDFQCDFVETNRFFKGDPCKIMQIINNFLSNAIKFTREGAVILSVVEKVNEDNTATLTFNVKDSGLGIAKEKQSLLFQAFGQLDASVTRKHGGTGLGLYICTQLASMMHGHITLESEEGRGSLFSFTLNLPIAKGLDIQYENNSGTYEPLRILVIVDQKKVSDMLCDFIRSFGFFVTAQKSSDDVVSKIKNIATPYHLIILDYELSKGSNGVDYYERLLQSISLSELPSVLMIATNDDVEIKERIYRAGIQSFLKKPINPSMLYDELVSLCTVASQTPLFDPSKIDLSSKRILIVEDNDINLEVATYLLKETHAKVEIARNGLEAVELIQEQEHPYDLILMDVQMPLMDGYEATRIIRKELNVLTPIVAMTANVMVQDIEKCIQSGMDAHIGKPFEVEDFYGTLLEVLHVSLSIAPKQQTSTKKRTKQRFSKKEAIKKLGGNEALWQKLFYNFYDTYLQLPERLKTFVEKQELTTLIDYAHTLKGLSGTVGVFILEQAFNHLEQFLKEHNSIKEAPLEPVLEEHRALLATLRSEYDQLDPKTYTANIQLAHDKQTLIALLKELSDALEMSNVSKVTSLLEQLATYESLREHELFKTLLLACKTFDFDAALESLEQLSKEIK
ncbi:response regulator [Sulfurospirillum oryzae]|uniref:response regulator n=1 Tax=Sulfurospirillum oryzae TaxID=2976535 RepID=UPI0021E90D62|nr:response regulator [Sulfurospirillum oryzae]